MKLHDLFDARFQEIAQSTNLGYVLTDTPMAASYAFAYFQGLTYDTAILERGGDYHPDCLVTVDTKDDGYIVVHKLGELVMAIRKDSESEKLILSMSDNVDDGLDNHFSPTDTIDVRNTILYTLGAMVLLKMPLEWVLGVVNRMTCFEAVEPGIKSGEKAYEEMVTYQEIVLALFDRLITDPNPFIFQTDILR